MKDLMIQAVQEAGALLRGHFGQGHDVTRKEDHSSIVTAADLAAERQITRRVWAAHPSHNVLGEEGGFSRRDSRFTWVIDPLDGTSNFAAGIPWFGVMVALLEEQRPVLAAIHLPMQEVLYVAEAGRGATRNAERWSVSGAADLSDTLCAFGLDSSADARQTRWELDLMSRVVRRARNLRATNSLVDFVYTLEGRFGATINSRCRIWDIAAATLVFPEAGGVITDFAGQGLQLSLADDACQRTYPMVAASPVLHPQVMELLRQVGPFPE